MSMKSKSNGATRNAAHSAPMETRRDSLENISHDETIRRRAYELYLARGDQPGNALDDWLQAERELTTGPWVVANTERTPRCP